ncbi:DUF948 domain-containing protein [Bacillus sp. SG-1]|uniref:DUF948 domain-containing protein n=1 Tax=Bacillus sp. SG-1 TaxID=161544 RepID=UPI0001544A3C|nr:DUF948 domain-containing protein [Bacillus sp. SG-1]EDL62912.1 hypothetical protein BSG1_08576 [Bacillus sp. SG-1]
MIIVYLSIALFVLSIAYLGYEGFKFMKKTKPTLDHLNKTVGSIQQRTQLLQEETNELSTNSQELKEDIDEKKDNIQYTVGEVKQLPKPVKKIWENNFKKPDEGKNYRTSNG